MFPRIRQHSLALLDQLVELSTLGEYGVAEDGTLLTLEPATTQAPIAPRLRDDCPQRTRSRACGFAEPARP